MEQETMQLLGESMVYRALLGSGLWGFQGCVIHASIGAMVEYVKGSTL